MMGLRPSKFAVLKLYYHLNHTLLTVTWFASHSTTDYSRNDVSENSNYNSLMYRGKNYGGTAACVSSFEK